MEARANSLYQALALTAAQGTTYSGLLP